ncbi:MAG: hypothetical protein HXS54_06050 [Theionarchaea archaeon]|nr:hypothetical protein [Theionarchaea archaeon]DBA34822.1 TPA_asm: hypothetical protein vir521_00028 [Caudoviricetes sp. vir521]
MEYLVIYKVPSTGHSVWSFIKEEDLELEIKRLQQQGYEPRYREAEDPTAQWVDPPALKEVLPCDVFHTQKESYENALCERHFYEKHKRFPRHRLNPHRRDFDHLIIKGICPKCKAEFEEVK